jgi:hypothetical protein
MLKAFCKRNVKIIKSLGDGCVSSRVIKRRERAFLLPSVVTTFSLEVKDKKWTVHYVRSYHTCTTISFSNPV